jgi:zinc/manganese transport system permease protein
MPFVHIMLPAFLECLILIGIHSYLGIHVIKRGVIFVDLALAQIAAFGSTLAFIFGLLPDSPLGFIFSFVATIIGAGIFSLIRSKEGRVPQEAGIGLTYAIFAAATILLIERAPHGSEHVQELLTGSILWVSWSNIALAATVYSLVGLFHYYFRERFILISENPERARQQGVNIRKWDFLFYLSFGLIITISVKTAGVLLVFVFLIAPAILGALKGGSWKERLLLGWISGLIVTIVGLTASYFFNLPSGPAIVICYGGLLLFSVLFYRIRK